MQAARAAHRDALRDVDARPRRCARAGRRTAARRPSRWPGPRRPGRRPRRSRAPAPRRGRVEGGEVRADARRARSAARPARGVGPRALRATAASRDRDDEVGQPGRDDLRRQLGVRVGGVEARARRAPAPGRARRRTTAGSWSIDARATPRRRARPRSAAARRRLLHVARRRARRARVRDGDRRAERRMAGERQLAARSSRCGCGSRRPARSRDWTNVVSESCVSRANASIVASSRPSASWTTARPLPASGARVKTSSQVSAALASSEVEVARRLLLEPEPVVLRRLLEELRRLLEHVLAVGLVVGRDDVLGGRRPRARVGGLGLAAPSAAPSAASSSSSENCARRLLDLGSRAPSARAASASATRLGSARRSGSGSRGGSAASRRSLGGHLVAVAARRSSVRIVARSARLVGLGVVGRPRRAPRSPRRAGPSASCSWRATSPGSAPWRRLSSRCSRMASSSSPMARQTLATQAATTPGEASARSVRFLPARLAR